MQKFKSLIISWLFLSAFLNVASAQVRDTVIQDRPVDSLKAKPVIKIKTKSSPLKDSVKVQYVNPGKVAGRNAMIKSLIIPGWGQLYNNQTLVKDYKAKGETSGHFWQKTYTLGKIGVIYTGFTLLTLSYIDNTSNYRVFLKEAQFRTLNPGRTDNPDLVRYTTSGITSNKDVFKRNRQVIIFSYAAVYLANVADAYVAARLHYFNIDDNLSFKISPSLINSNNNMFGFNFKPAIKVSLIL